MTFCCLLEEKVTHKLITIDPSSEESKLVLLDFSNSFLSLAAVCALYSDL